MISIRSARTLSFILIVIGTSLSLTSAHARDYPYDDMIEVQTPHSFDALFDSLSQSVKDNDMLLVARASASRGAAGRGIDIPGNAVIEVYRNDFAVRMLKASIAAGYEAPIRFYLTAEDDGTTTLAYRRPSAVFAPYKSDELDTMAKELDVLFARIVEQAVH